MITQVLCVVLASLHVSYSFPQCANYKVINDPYRSTAYRWVQGTEAICDLNLVKGAYRFNSSAGNMMPTEKPKPYHCGTHIPVWMKGANPDPNSGFPFAINRGCYEYGGQETCPVTIIAIYCKSVGFYVYILEPLQVGCPMAYCAGDKIPPCPRGQPGSDCSGKIVKFSKDYFKRPRITYDENEASENVTLLCNVELVNVSTWKNVTYHVEWLRDGVFLRNVSLCEPPSSSIVNKNQCPGEPQLVARLGQEYYGFGESISCKVRGRFTNIREIAWGEARESERFYVGIKVEPSILKISRCSNWHFRYCDYYKRYLENFGWRWSWWWWFWAFYYCQNRVIFLQPTIPIRRLIHAKVDFALPTGFMIDKCSVQLQGTKPHFLMVNAKCGNTVTEITEKDSLHVILKIKSNSSFWNHNFHAIKINLKDAPLSSCYSYTDPHFNTFDGQYFAYMGTGDHRLYKKKNKNKETVFEIQTRQWVCSNPWRSSSKPASCNCAAIIRDYNDIIEFNCCNEKMYFDRITPLRKRIRSKGKLAYTTSIKQTNSGFNARYTLTFGSGIRVQVYRNSYGMNIYVEAPRNNETHSGLCGNYNGNWADDISGLHNTSEKFGDFNRVKDVSENLFFDPAQKNFTVVPDIAETCGCVEMTKNQTSNNETNEVVNTCKDESLVEYVSLGRKTISFDITNDIANNVDEGEKREVVYSDALTDEDFEFFLKPASWETSSHKSRRVKRTVDASQWSRENATNFCKEKVLGSQVTSSCVEVVVIDTEEIIRQCSDDVFYTGDGSFAVAAVNLVMDTCEEKIIKNFTQLKNDTKTKKIVESVAERLCPNDCTSNGNCSNGTCICKEGFTAHDCSAEINQKPLLYSVQSRGLCDKRQRPCEITTVFGEHFLDSSNLTCHLEFFKVIDSPWAPSSSVQNMSARLTDLTLVECKLPTLPVTPGFYHEEKRGTPAAGIRLAVSNNGDIARKSNTLEMISYDSACLSCNASSRTCVHKESTCLIDGYCFAFNESNPNDWCYQCLPPSNNSGWTWRKVNLKPRIITPSTRYALLNEDLPLKIESHDPEGRPTTISMMSGDSSAIFTASNVLQWSPRDNSSKTFAFLVSDECNATNVNSITIEVVNCPCKNGGKCKAVLPRGSGLYTCECLLGFSGKQCETNVDDCKPFACVNGTCIDQINGYRCDCEQGFTGKRCDTLVKFCTNESCFAGVNCIDHVGGFRCGPCPAGLTGNGINCTAIRSTSSDGRQFSTPNTLVSLKASMMTSSFEKLSATSTKTVSSLESVDVLASEATASKRSVTTIISSSDYGNEIMGTYTSYQKFSATMKTLKMIQTTGKSGNTIISTPVETPRSVWSSQTDSRAADLTVTKSQEDTEATAEPSSSIQEAQSKTLSSVVGNNVVKSLSSKLPIVTEITRTTHPLEPSSEYTSKKILSSTMSTVTSKEDLTTEVAAEIRLLEVQWSNELGDKNSKRYHKLKLSFQRELERVYEENPNFRKAKVLAFSKGSVIVDFILQFNLKQEQPLNLLKVAIQKGKLGDFSVDKSSLKEKAADNSNPNTGGSSSMLLFLVLGIVCGLIVVVILVVILTYVFKKKKRDVILRSSSKGHVCLYGQKCDLPDCMSYALDNVAQDKCDL